MFKGSGCGDAPVVEQPQAAQVTDGPISRTRLSRTLGRLVHHMRASNVSFGFLTTYAKRLLSSEPATSNTRSRPSCMLGMTASCVPAAPQGSSNPIQRESCRRARGVKGSYLMLIEYFEGGVMDRIPEDRIASRVWDELPAGVRFQRGKFELLTLKT